MIDKKFYQDNATPKEIELIKTRVRMFRNSIIWFDELPYPTPFSVQITFNEIERLAQPFDCYYMVINLTEVITRTDAEVRKNITRRFKEINNRVKHTAVFTGKNVVINAAASFILSGLQLGSFSVTKTKEQAIKNVEDALGR